MMATKLFAHSTARNLTPLRYSTEWCGTGLTSKKFMENCENDPVLTYKKNSPERIELEKRLHEMASETVHVPICIGTEKIYNDLENKQVMPSDHKTVLAKFTYATSQQINKAIETGMKTKRQWEMTPLRDRAEILLRAADLISGKYRMTIIAATMLGQGKSIYQAEIDAACELTDFLRFNAMFALKYAEYQPISPPNVTNSMILRGLDGFVAAISPFNFTAIGGNLASAPALMGNIVLWKPSDTALLSNYIIYRVLEEAGMPPGVISFIPAAGEHFAEIITGNKHLAGINFTGSVDTFKKLWSNASRNLGNYVSFPRMAGECGGKNFHFVHESADLDVVAACTIRSAFEYTGQKCSACSRLFVPKSCWNAVRNRMASILKELHIGDVRDGTIFTSAVIDAKAYDRIISYIEYARSGVDGATIVFGGTYDNSKGFYVQPTVITVTDWNSNLLIKEIFGPVLSVVVYEDYDALKTLKMLRDASIFGLTGAVFAQDKDFLYMARDELRDAVGNLYLNDKSTGAIVGQQPFGGSRMSGTNDKAGGPHNLLRWTSPQCIKESHTKMSEWRYPSMD